MKIGSDLQMPLQSGDSLKLSNRVKYPVNCAETVFGW